MSCKTTKVEIKYKYYVPELDFPDFPKVGEFEKTKPEKIEIEENFFKRLLAFKTQYKDLILKYNEKKMLMEENEL